MSVLKEEFPWMVAFRHNFIARSPYCFAFCYFPTFIFAALPDDYIDTIVDSISALNVTDNYCSVVYFTALGGAVKEVPENDSPFLFKGAK